MLMPSTTPPTASCWSDHRRTRLQAERHRGAGRRLLRKGALRRRRRQLEGVISRGSFSLDLGGQAADRRHDQRHVQGEVGKDLNDTLARSSWACRDGEAINRAKSTDGEKIRAALAATNIPGEQTIMPWKRVKFDEIGQNNDADPVLLQYVGGSSSPSPRRKARLPRPSRR